MAVTAISDIINPQVLADQVSAKYPDQLVLGNTSLVEVNGEFPLGAPGTTFTMPGWKRIPAFSSLSEGTAMGTGKIGTISEQATVQRGGGAYEVYDTASLVSMADPVAEVSTQIGRRSAEYIDAALVVETNKTPNTYDGSASTFDQNTLVKALVATLGDNFMQMINGGGRVIMHSKVYGDLLQVGAIQNQYQSGMDAMKTAMIPTLSGLPIQLSDLVTTSTVSGTTYYQTYVVGPGALALIYQREVMIEFDRDVLLRADIVAASVDFAVHLYGWDDVSAAMVAEQAKSIKAVSIKTK